MTAKALYCLNIGFLKRWRGYCISVACETRRSYGLRHGGEQRRYFKFNDDTGTAVVLSAWRSVQDTLEVRQRIGLFPIYPGVRTAQEECLSLILIIQHVHSFTAETDRTMLRQALRDKRFCETDV